MYPKKYVFFWMATALISLALVVSLAFSRGADEDLYRQGEVYAEIYRLIRENYVDEDGVDPDKLLYGALKGMAEATGDDYSTYLCPEEFEAMHKATQGKYIGVGIQIRLRDDKFPEIVNSFRNSPAHKAGVKPGDIIEKADGVLLKGLKLHEIANLISGKAGTKVRLTLISRGETESHTLEMERAVVKFEYVTSGIIDESNKIGYARLVGFGEDASADLDEAIRTLQAGGMKGFVLDLRDNGGGLLEQAIAVSNLFIEKGVIVSTQGRTRRATRVYDAKPAGTLLADGKIPVVVLINGNSASASEIVAGALQDHNRAVLFGTKSFGKNSVQNLYKMEDGKSALKLTVAYYFTPNNRSLVEGLVPDRKTAIDIDEWHKVLDNRDKYEIGNGGKPYTGKDDTQLAAAIEFIAGQLRGQ